MNLNANPSVDQLRKLLAQCNDSAGHHVLWVKKSGDVELSRIPKDKLPGGFLEGHPEMQMRYEAFEAGNEYVGPKAAEDSDWLTELIESLLQEWAKAKGKSEVAYINML